MEIRKKEIIYVLVKHRYMCFMFMVKEANRNELISVE